MAPIIHLIISRDIITEQSSLKSLPVHQKERKLKENQGKKTPPTMLWELYKELWCSACRVEFEMQHLKHQ